MATDAVDVSDLEDEGLVERESGFDWYALRVAADYAQEFLDLLEAAGVEVDRVPRRAR